MELEWNYYMKRLCITGLYKSGEHYPPALVESTFNGIKRLIKDDAGLQVSLLVGKINQDVERILKRYC